MSDSRAEKETSGRNEKEMSGRSEQKTSVSSEKERSEKELSGRSEKEMSEGSEKEMSRSEKKDQEKLLYQDVMKYIMERAYRVDAEKNWKRTIRRKAGEFVLEDGQLYTKGDDRRRWVFDEEDQKRVTEACHDEKLGGGHFGRDKTLQKACSRFYWHDMTNDIKEHIRTCDTCQRTNKKLSKASVRSEVWHQVGIELVGPLTLTQIESEAQRHAARLDTIRTETFMKVASNIENAQAKQKLYYDRKHAKAEFKLGSPVLLRNMRKLSRKGGKMDDEWTGPFTIAELKTYEERQIHEAASDLGQVHAAASDEEIASKIEQDFTASHNEESANELAFNPAEDDDDFEVMETRKLFNKDDVVLDSLNLASKPDLNVCASGFIKLRPDNCTTNEAKVSMNDCDEEKQQSKKTSDEEKPIKKARKVRCRKQWMEVEDVKLYEEHRCILESNKWVDDVLINASQFLLHSQYGRSGFQATTLAYNLRFDVMREFIQILHNGEDHWVTISTIGLPSGHVNVFDSLYDTCNNFIIEQICAILCTPNDAVVQEVLRVYPPVSNVAKEEPRGGIMLSGYYIPERTAVFCCAEILPEYFNDPDTFDPSQFDADKTRPGPFVYFPFGLSHRSCIGRHFAMIEAKVILARLLQTFKPGVEEGISAQGTLPPLTTTDEFICGYKGRNKYRDTMENEDIWSSMADQNVDKSTRGPPSIIACIVAYTKSTNPVDMLGSIPWLILYPGGGLLRLVTTAFLLFSLHVAYIHWKYSHIPSPKMNSFFLGHIANILTIRKESGNEILPFADVVAKCPVIFSSNPDDVKIMATDEHIDKSAPSIKPIRTLFGRRFMGQGLLTIPDYDTWKPRRKLYDPLFKRSSLKDLLLVFNECVDAFLEGLRPLADGKTEVPMKEAFHEATLDVISKLLYPKEIGMYREAVDAMRRIGRDCIEKRIKAVTSGEEVPNDILTQILQISIADKSIDMETLVDDFVTFYIAGQETTANTLSFAIILIQQHPEVLESLLSEIADVLGDRKEVTGDDLDKLKYTEQACAAFPMMCRNPEYFNVPDTFDPSRFDADKTRPGPFVYFPFGLSHRSCIGRHFAMVEAKVILARLLQTFKVTLPPSYKLVVEQKTTQQPKGDVPCTLRCVTQRHMTSCTCMRSL
eukprot:Em0020g448a